MERIPDDTFLKYNQDTLSFMRKKYNLDKPGQMEEAIDLLDSWLKKQNHFCKKDYSKEYLERVIILLKGSIERAKTQIEKISTLRTLLPHFFEKLDVKKDFKGVIGKYLSPTLLPRLTKEHQRVCLVRVEAEPYTSKIFLLNYFISVLFCEYLKANDYSDGILFIADFQRVKSVLDFVTHVNLIELKQITTIILQGYGARTQKFILISSSGAIDLVVKILRQILPEKLVNRIHIARDIDELHKLVPKEVLPSDYGGDDKPLPQLMDDFLDALTTTKHMEYLKMISQAKTNEALRTTSKINDDLLGIQGSFRTLDFD